MPYSIEVSVPATSANLGPGYDTFGLALDIADEVVAELHPGPVDLSSCVEVTGQGDGQVPTSSDHLIHRVVREVLDHHGHGALADRLTLRCANTIPHSRGMGSSAAAVVAGISIADALLAFAGRGELTEEERLAWAVHYEGHADNAAPALFGGVSISTLDAEGSPRSVSVPVHPAVRAVLIVPDTKLDTDYARSFIPEQIPHADAVANSAAAALFIHAIGRAPSLLFEATEDHLHQEYRRPAMPETLARVDALRAHGLAAVVSGAGPTALVLGTGENLRDEVASVLGDDDARIIAASIADFGATITRTDA